MSGLRSALEEWASQDLTEVAADQLAEDLVELEVACGVLESERAGRLSRFDEIGGPKTHGHPSLTAFLIHQCRIAAGRARRLVGLAHTAATCPRVHDAWAEQRISTDQAHRLLEAADSAPGPFHSSERALLEIVESLSPSETRRALLYWRHAAADHAGTELEQEARRGISLSGTIDGLGRIDGWLTPLAYETLRAALDTLMPAPVGSDHRTARQRRHDALEDIARDFLDHGDTPSVGGEKPHLNVIVDWAALTGIAGGRHEFEDGEVIDLDVVRKITCDSSVCRIVFGPGGEIIDVGRRTRIISPALRRAVIARDRHCTWHGCDRNPRWCDAHHIVSWAEGGATEPGNLRLLCRYHHTLIHQGDEDRGPPNHP